MHELAVFPWVCLFIATVTLVLSSQHAVNPLESVHLPLGDKNPSKLQLAATFGKSLVSPAREENIFSPPAESVSVSNRSLKIT